MFVAESLSALQNCKIGHLSTPVVSALALQRLIGGNFGDDGDIQHVILVCLRAIFLFLALTRR